MEETNLGYRTKGRKPITNLSMMINGIQILETITRLNIKYGRLDNLIENDRPTIKTIPRNEVGNMYTIPSIISDDYCRVPQMERLTILQTFLKGISKFLNENDARDRFISLVRDYHKGPTIGDVDLNNLKQPDRK